MAADLRDLEQKLGHSFSNRDLLVRAVTHRSYYAHRSLPLPYPNNAQLEFLGDSILGFIVSEHLLATFPTATEGQLTKIKARLVSGDRLAEAARLLELGEFLRLGRGEEVSGGRDRRSFLSDTLEAIIAALYLDGGLDAARPFVEQHIIADAIERPNVNFKGELDERTAALGLPKPRYTTVEHTDGVFHVEVAVGENYVCRGSGSTRKAAEQQGARVILEQLGLTTGA